LSLRYQGPFRLIVHSPLEGRRNMAVDEHLMEAVGRAMSPPVIRLYGFSPPTLSLDASSAWRGASITPACRKRG